MINKRPNMQTIRVFVLIIKSRSLFACHHKFDDFKHAFSSLDQGIIGSLMKITRQQNHLVQLVLIRTHTGSTRITQFVRTTSATASESFCSSLYNEWLNASSIGRLGDIIP